MAVAVIPKFQFPNGSIKRPAPPGAGGVERSFNSLMVRLKEVVTIPAPALPVGFNSLMVRLKVWQPILKSIQKSSFNSLMVRLKGNRRLFIQKGE